MKTYHGSRQRKHWETAELNGLVLYPTWALKALFKFNLFKKYNAIYLSSSMEHETDVLHLTSNPLFLVLFLHFIHNNNRNDYCSNFFFKSMTTYRCTIFSSFTMIWHHHLESIDVFSFQNAISCISVGEHDPLSKFKLHFSSMIPLYCSS